MMTLAAIWGVLSEGFKALGLLLGVIQSEQQKQAGVDQQRAADAEAEAAALHRVDQVSAEGQTNEQTQTDLSAGKF